MSTLPSPYSPLDMDGARPVRPRTWRDKFGDAFRGLKWGVRGQSSFFVHFFFAALVLAGAIVLRCDLAQWGLLTLAIGMVLTAELFNSAIEALFRGLHEHQREQCFQCLNISAGAVLLASLFAVAVGLMVFINQIVLLLNLDG